MLGAGAALGVVGFGLQSADGAHGLLMDGVLKTSSQRGKKALLLEQPGCEEQAGVAVLHLSRTHPGSVALALVAKSEDEAYGQNRYDNGEQDTHIVVWLKRGKQSQWLIIEQITLKIF